jgi:glycosyltransferase involved in cell wall biosynthesis
VIAWNCGSVPEVVEEGVTGFIVESEAQAFAAVARLPGINRRAVRAAFEQRFTASIMARTYLNVYAGMLQAHTNAMRGIKTVAETV